MFTFIRRPDHNCDAWSSPMFGVMCRFSEGPIMVLTADGKGVSMRQNGEWGKPVRLKKGQQVNGKDRIFGWFAEQIRSRNGEHSKPIVCLMDGDRALWEKVKGLMEIVGVPILCILDVFHVLERLWSAAYCFHSEGSA